MKPVLVQMPPMEHSESDAFLSRIASCTSSAEVREVVEQVQKLYAPAPPTTHPMTESEETK